MNPVVRSFLFITFLVRGHIPPCKLDLQFPSKWSTSNKLKLTLGASPVPWPSALPRVDLPKATSSCLFDMSKRPADEPAAVRSSQRPRVAPGWRREGGAAELVAGPSHLVPSLRSRARALLTDAPCA